MKPPPLSRQLKDLEDEIGKPLLIRGSKKITLAEDGVLLRKRAKELQSLYPRIRYHIYSGAAEKFLKEIQARFAELTL